MQTKIDEIEYIAQKQHKRAVSFDMLTRQIKEFVSFNSI